MRKEERDRIMMHISQEQRADFRRIISEIRAARKATSGRGVAIRELLASNKIEVPPPLREVVEAVIERDETGPKVGEPAPDFRLQRLGAEERVRLSSFQGKKPVALVFGSYTWPPFRAQVRRMEEIYHRFRDQVAFFVVYVQEAHPTDGWQVDSNIQEGILYRQHQTFDEREAAANACSLDLQLPLPVLIEDMDNVVDEAYGAAPERLYLIGSDGRVIYQGGAGPHFFDLDEWEQAIAACVKTGSHVETKASWPVNGAAMPQ